MQNNDPIWFNKKQDVVKEIHLGEPQKPKYSIFVATPVHSDVSIHYCQSLLTFQLECMKRNIMVSFHLLKSSLVQQGRNLCVADFLNAPEGPYTHMLFIDSDIDFEPKTIFKMLDKDKDLIACPYPMKMLSWDRAWNRLQEGDVKDQESLMKAGYTFPIKMDSKEFAVEDGVMEATHAPTGCMLIKREVFQKMIKHYPELKISQPTIINGEAKEKENLYNFFDCLHDPETKKFYGEDFGFCKRWGAIGGKLHLLIDHYITHVGEYQYCGRFFDDLKIRNNVDESNKS